MRNLNRAFTLLLIGVIAFSCLSILTVKPASAQKPATPTFTVSIDNSTYTTPATITTDPYTGANVTNAGHTTVSIRVTVTIQNSTQATAYLLGIKGHYSTQWQYPWQDDYNITAFASSDSQTVLTFSGNNATGAATNQIFLRYGGNYDWGFDVPFGGKLDFQLQAVNGETPMRVLFGYAVYGEVSGWSTIQTVDVPDFAATATATVSPNPTLMTSPSPTAVPSAPEFPALATVPLLLSALALVLILKHRKTTHG